MKVARKKYLDYHKKYNEAHREERRELSRLWRLKNKERRKEYNRKWALNHRKNHPELYKARDAKYNKKKKEDYFAATGIRNYWNSPHYRFIHYKSRAKRKGFVFSITEDLFTKLLEDKCHYCGTKEESMTVDRKDSLVGYTTENCLTACKTCNFIKSNLEYDIFINKCIQISNNLS